MAWLDAPDDRATPELERLTEPWRRRGEQVPPVMAVLKNRPRAFEAVLGVNYALTFGASSLGRRREELLAVWVSALNDCFFCLATHARYLEQVWGANPDELLALLPRLRALAQLAQNPDQRARWFSTLDAELATLPALHANERVLLAFVATLTLAPDASTEPGFARLRAAGLGEAESLDAVLVAGCFALMNRLASGTGVTLDAAKHSAAERTFGRPALEQHLAWGQRSPEPGRP